MEQHYNTVRKVTFHGQGSRLFGIYIVNLLLTVFSFGLYYPWAKAALLKYLYEESEFEGSRFTFHGTGKEMFIGFIKVIAIFLVIYGVLIGSILSKITVIMIVGMLVFYAALLLLIPVAIHGSMRYRMSRSSWRGIHFGYRGDLKEFVKMFVTGSLLSIFTFGIYSFWFIIDIRKYIFKNLRFGSLTFSYEGNGTDFFVLNLKGYLLTLITLGIYSFWYIKDLFAYYVDNIRLHQDNNRIVFRSTATAGSYFRLFIGNFFIVLFTLGLGIPWAIIRAINFVFSHIVIEGSLDVNAIRQTEEDYTDATGEDLADMIDIGLV